MNSLDDEMAEYAERLAQRNAAREERLRKLGLIRQEQQQFDEEERQLQAKREERQQLIQQQIKQTSPSKQHLISFSKQMSEQKSNPSSPVKQLTPTSPIKKDFICASPTKSDKTSSIKSYAPSPLRPHNFATSPLKPSVFTPPKIDLRSIKPVEFSPSTLQHKSPIRSVSFSPANKPASPLLSTFNQSPKPFGGSAPSPVKALIEEQEREQLEQSKQEEQNKVEEVETNLTFEIDYEKKLDACDSTPKPIVNNKISNLLSTFDQKCQKNTASPVTPSVSNCNMSKSNQTKSSVKARAQMFESNQQDAVQCAKPPERLCVSDKKKLFESAIKRETENAKRNREQQLFLSRTKNLFQQDDCEIDLKKRKENDEPDLDFNEKLNQPMECESSTDLKADQECLDTNVEDNQANAYNSQSNQDAEEMIQETLQTQDQCSSTNDVNEKVQSSSSIISIPPAMPIINGYVEKPPTDTAELGRKLNIEKMKARLQQKLYGAEDEDELEDESILLYTAPSPVKSKPVEVQEKKQLSPRKSMDLYPKLPSVEEEVLHLEESLPISMASDIESDIQRLNELSKDKSKMETKSDTARLASVTTTNKPITPIRTLSMYRREQKVRAAQNVTPSRAIRPSEDAVDRNMMRQLWRKQTKDRISSLKKDIEQFDVVMAQTSNAVTLCLKTGEFRGSLEQLEAEKILLVTTKKRLACQKEIARLAEMLNKDMASAEPLEGTLDKPSANGSITVLSVAVPLKSEFIVNQVSEQDPLDHHLFCVFTCAEKVIHTKILCSARSIQKDGFWFEDELVFPELDNQFELKLELYAMALPRDRNAGHFSSGPSHDRKTNLLHSIKFTPLSPRPKHKKSTPSFNYSSNDGFTRLGMIKLNMNNINRKKHNFDEISMNSPLEGFAQIQCKMQASYGIELRDYLNFSEESGGYSVWNRRWCVLKGYYLAYWRFAEDEQSKPSLGVIDLRQCVCPQIGPVTYELCARKNTFLMVCIQAKENDGNASPMKNKMHKTMIAKKHLISADLKEEMDLWCKNLNLVLESVRVWESNCLQPYEPSQLDRLIRH